MKVTEDDKMRMSRRIREGNEKAAAAKEAAEAFDVPKIKMELLKIIYPVGSLYLTTIPEYPGLLLGFGTWEAYAQGCALVGYKDGDPDFGTVGVEVGEKEHALDVDELPEHQHEEAFPSNPGSDIAGNFAEVFGAGRTATQTGQILEIFNTDAQSAVEGDEVHPLVSATGGNQPHNNIQPSITIYVWIRTY